MHKFLPLFASTFLSVAIAHGQLIKNDDFSNGKAHWEGAGQVVTLDKDQKPASTTSGGIPQLEVVLNHTAVQQANQRLTFKPDEAAKQVKVTIVVKTSPDFIRNDKAQQFSKDPKWRVDSRHETKDLAYPNVDLTCRVDGDRHYYLLRGLKAGGDWQTITGEYPTLGNSTGKNFSLIFPAGTGAVWVKSVSIDLK
jgi:hypothetical protein